MANLKSASQPRAPGKRASQRMRLVIGAAIIVLVVGWLVYSSIQGSSAYYLTVEELKARGPSDRIVRTTGFVVAQTIHWDSQRMILQFEIADKSGSLPVLYKGVRPDLLQDGAQAVVEGRYVASGVFEATAVLLRCPSKYVEK